LSVPAPEALEVTLNGAGSRPAVKDVLLRSTLRLQSDEKLVELLRQGFAPAFDVMVERYRLPLTRYCARMVGADNADDIVQETFTASYSALGNDDRPIQLKPWLYRVAHNTAISALRKKGRHEHEELDENFDGVRQPHDQLEQSQRLHDLVANMRALPERQRTAIVLQELEGMSPEEIADELDGSVPMVRQLVHRARERLRNGVGMLIPLPLLLKLFGAERTAAATGKSLGGTAATTKSAGATLAGTGATAAGSGAKLAVILAVGALAGGGIAVERAIDPGAQDWKAASADQAAGGWAAAAPKSARLANRSHTARRSSPGTAAATPHTNDAATPAVSEGKDGAAERPSDAPRSENGPDSTNDRSAPEGGSPPASDDSSGSAPSQAPAAGSSPSSGGGSGSAGGQEGAGGGSQPSGGGGGTPPGGGGSTPSCKPVLGIPLPLICL
jgi:RNA polymerase sigma factor (sigma-70 family)